ncbi:Aste57867_21958 [Aphanomyces stellatus]|uniref:Aste57867_21958 protein n=1 Tax=Aphanomyces stellatus TaxID=120398 RepID=A0A485LK88_9STRA|nr:hypothetical protein As57867_021889 [Aphanomyces stellatus]VFT98626.1 Aste57867_21958 [Aphanomyces stellatus]
MQSFVQRVRKARPSRRQVVVATKAGGVESAMEALPQIEICHVMSTATTKECTMYTVYIQNAKSGRSWVVHRRYTDFVSLRVKLLAALEPFYFLIHRCVDDLKAFPFPKRAAFVGQRVIRRREKGFLTFLRAIHTLVLDPDYGLDDELQGRCFSVLRGFFGSMDVLHPSHAEYFCQTVTPQAYLHTSHRKCIARCGELDTVLEEDVDLSSVMDEDNNRADNLSVTLAESSMSNMSLDDPAAITKEVMPVKVASGASKTYSMFFSRRKLSLCQQAALV